MLPVLSPTFSLHRTIQEVGSVKLDPWLAGRNLQNPTTGRVTYSKIKQELTVGTKDFLSPLLCVCAGEEGFSLSTWQHVFPSRDLKGRTDRSCGRTLDQEAL